MDEDNDGVPDFNDNRYFMGQVVRIMIRARIRVTLTLTLTLALALALTLALARTLARTLTLTLTARRWTCACPGAGWPRRSDRPSYSVGDIGEI